MTAEKALMRLFTVLLCIGFCTQSALGQLARRPGLRDAEEIRQTAEAIMASPEFRHLTRLKNNELLRRLGLRGNSEPGDGKDAPKKRDAQGSARSSSDDAEAEPRTVTLPRGIELISSAFGALFHGIAWFVLIVVCGFIVYLLARAFWNAESPPSGESESEGERIAADEEPEHAPGELSGDFYRDRARQLAAEGSFREAIAQLLFGAMSHIERAGLVRFRRGLTHRDYLRAVRGERPVHAALQSMVRIYEPIGFGRREATREHYDAACKAATTGRGRTATSGRGFI